MLPVTVVCAALLGAAVGMLTPWATHRLAVPAPGPARSACGRCGRPFPPGVSGWLRAGSRCPGCGDRPGPGRTSTLLSGGAAFALLAWALGPVPALAPFLVAAGLGLLLAFVDLACLRLPDPLVVAMLAGAGGPLLLLAALAGEPARIGRAALVGCLYFAGYLVLALLPRTGLGFGDVKLAGVLGLLLGWLGWPAALLGVLLPHLVNGPVVLALLLARRVDRRAQLPLGPALLAGALLAAVLAARWA